MPKTPQVTFRLTPDDLAELEALQEHLKFVRGKPKVSKAEAVRFAVMVANGFAAGRLILRPLHHGKTAEDWDRLAESMRRNPQPNQGSNDD